MANNQQAPTLLAKGEKMNTKTKWGKAIRTHELETAIMCGLGERDMAMLKIMLFLTGNAADGSFKVAEKTICERCKISESGYKTARKKLVAMGWITLKASESITVNYDVILNQYRKGITENTPTENLKSMGYTEKSPQGYTEKSPQGYTEKSPQGYTEKSHNNISNNIHNYDNSADLTTKVVKSSIEIPEAEGFVF